MRTTVDLDEDILRVGKHLALEKGQSLGQVLSDLARKGLQPVPISRKTGCFPVLARKPGARPVTTKDIKELLEFSPSAP